MPKRGGKKTYFPGRRGRNANFFVSKVNTSIALGALVNNTVIGGTLIDLAQDAYLISADLTWSLHNLTAGEGPIAVGLNNNALSVAEIGEALDASPTSQSDIITKEQASRPVRNAGQFPGLNTEEVLNNGGIRRVKLKFVLSQSQDLSAWARNLADATLTTGAILQVIGKVYGNWK